MPHEARTQGPVSPPSGKGPHPECLTHGRSVPPSGTRLGWHEDCPLPAVPPDRAEGAAGRGASFSGRRPLQRWLTGLLGHLAVSGPTGLGFLSGEAAESHTGFLSPQAERELNLQEGWAGLGWAGGPSRKRGEGTVQTVAAAVRSEAEAWEGVTGARASRARGNK